MEHLERPDGTRLAYTVHHPDGPGTPLLLSHGFGATSAMWGPNVAALAADRPVVTWDFRGHGASDAPDDPDAYSEDAIVADIDALLDATGAERAALGGMSLGGYLTLAYHRAHPDRVAALILVDTGPGFRDGEARARWNRMAEGYARAIEADGLPRRTPELAVARHRHLRGVVHTARRVLVQADDRVMASLPTIAVPTLVVVGEDDAGYRAGSAYMAERIPGARLVVVPGAGHAANMERPAAFDAAVAGFLAGVDG
ncbi:MAG TPA: alpha/beta fold hydrolase [Acidimicrobiales bacterium]|nr:alpha/beta fold hydrolase [Acidimicrobiales bacterium]